MRRNETLLEEMEREARTARRHLARVPEERLGWRPHPRSSTAGALAAHLVDCIRFAGAIFGADELDLDPATYAPFHAATLQELLDAFDAELSLAVRAMARTGDAEAVKPWRLRIGGRVQFERPREAAFRDMALGHLIHHRGQLSVYLRLMDVPVPGSYGPTADEREP